MLLIDKDLTNRGSELIAPFNASQVTNIGYDLKTDCFFLDAQTSRAEVELLPGDTVFVRTLESVTLPDNLAASIQLKNSRIRQGLSLTAPLYQPGHETKIFFRITNSTKQAIHLGPDTSLAYIAFITLSDSAEHPYSGGFQGETGFVGMGAYQSDLSADMTEIEKKVDSVKSIERNVYGNVLSIMGIFVGIFSLINVNLSLVSSNVTMATLLTFNFATVGAIAFLIGLIGFILPSGRSQRPIWIASAIAFALSILVQFIH